MTDETKKLISDSGQGRTLRNQKESSSLRVGGDTQMLFSETSYSIDANYYKGGDGKSFLDKKRRQLVVPLTEKRTEHAKEIRKQSRKEGKDWCSRRDKKLEPRKDDSVTALTSGQSKEQLLMEKTEVVDLPHKIRFRKLDSAKSGCQGKDVMKPDSISDVVDNHPKYVAEKERNEKNDKQ